MTGTTCVIMKNGLEIRNETTIVLGEHVDMWSSCKFVCFWL